MWHWTCLFLNSKNVDNNKIINAYFKHCVVYWLQFASCEWHAKEKKTFTFLIWGERWTATLYVETVLVKLLFLNFMNTPIYGAKRFCCRSVMRMGQTGYYFFFNLFFWLSCYSIVLCVIWRSSMTKNSKLAYGREYFPNLISSFCTKFMMKRENRCKEHIRFAKSNTTTKLEKRWRSN